MSKSIFNNFIPPQKAERYRPGEAKAQFGHYIALALEHIRLGVSLVGHIHKVADVRRVDLFVL